jgi:L-talarate/galactarate dehydratase
MSRSPPDMSPAKSSGPRVGPRQIGGGITQFLKLAALADHANLQVAPHFAMEIPVHLAAAYPHEPWVEHFDWLYPLFNERLETSGGRMHLSDRPGLGVTLTEQARAWTVDRVHIAAPR